MSSCQNCLNVLPWAIGNMDFEFSPNVVMFQANSDEMCQRFNKTITLPSVLLSCVFNFYITFCKYPCCPPILRWKNTHSQFILVHLVHSQFYAIFWLENLLKPPWSPCGGRTWAVARRFVPLANRRAGKTMAIVFQIRLQLVRAKSVFQSPDRI